MHQTPPRPHVGMARAEDEPASAAPQVERAVETLRLLVGVPALLLGVTWILAGEWLVRSWPSGPTTKVNSALALLLVVVGLTRHRSRRLACGSVVGMIGFASLLEYVGGWSFGIDQLVAADPEGGATPGRMSPATALCFVLLGLTVVARDGAGRGSRWLRVTGTFLVLVAAATGIVGYGLGSPPVLRFGPWVTMALPTAVALALASAAVVLSSPELPRVVRPSVGGVMLRRTLLAAVAVPFCVAWVALSGYSAGWYETRFALAVATAVTMAVLSLALSYAAAIADSTDAARRASDANLLRLESQRALLAVTQASEQRFRESVDLMPDSVSVFAAIRDDAGTITDFRWTYANEASAAVTGYDRDSLEGRTLMDVLPHHGPSGMFDNYAAVVETGEPYVEPTLWYSDVWGDGQERRRAFDVRATKLEDGFVVVTREVTEERIAEEELAERGRELQRANTDIRRLGDLGDLLQACVTPEDAFVVAAQCCEGLFEGRSGALTLIEPSRDVAEPVMGWGPGHARFVRFAPSSCWALRLGRPHESALRGPRCEHLADQVGEAVLCVPMMGQGETLGVLHLTGPIDDHGTEATAFDASTRQMAGATAVRLGLALANLRLQEKLRYLSIADPLTGLYNRRYMEESMQRELRRCERELTPLSVLQIDIDHFKRFNDDYGHETGDAVLVAVAKVFGDFFRDADVVCRSGGEEFTIILPGASAAEAHDRAQQLCELLRSRQIPVGPTMLRLPTISGGIAAYPGSGTTTATLLRASDLALYEAKRAGRDRIILAPLSAPATPAA